MTIVLKTKNEKGYHKTIENVEEVKEIGEVIKYLTVKTQDNNGEYSIYVIIKNTVERIVM